MSSPKWILVIFSVIFAIGTIVGFSILFSEILNQRSDYNDCRNNLMTNTALITNVANYTSDTCSNCRRLQLKYVTGKIGEVVTYLNVQCQGNLCTNTYVTGNHLIINYQYHEPGKPHLVKPECHYDPYTRLFYLSLGFMLVCLVGLIITLTGLNVTVSPGTKTKTTKKTHQVPQYDDKTVYFIDENEETQI